MNTSICSIVYHDTIAFLKSFANSELGGHVEKVSHELLLIIAHLSMKVITETYIPQLRQVVALLWNDEKVRGGTGMNITESTTLLSFPNELNYDAILEYDIRRDGLVCTLLK